MCVGRQMGMVENGLFKTNAVSGECSGRDRVRGSPFRQWQERNKTESHGPSSTTTGPLPHKNLKRNQTPGARMRILTATLTPQYGTLWHDMECEQGVTHGTGNPNTHTHL